MQFTIERLVELISKPQDNQIAQRLYDIWCDSVVLAATLDGEGRSESVTGRIAIGHTVKNRREHYPRDKDKRYWEVCLRRLQYSCWWDIGGKENSARTLSIMAALFDGVEFPIGKSETDRFFESLWIAKGIIEGETIDPTHGATHYVTKPLYHSRLAPSWTHDAGKIRAAIGSHVFFGDIA